MEKIRKGNDIEVQWAIYVGVGINEAPYDLTGRNLHLYLRNQFGRTEIYEYTVDRHVIRFMYWGKDQTQTGTYSIELIENEGRQGMHTVDECDAFTLVSHSCQTGGDSEGRVECVHLQFRANMGISVPSIGAEIKVDDALSLTSENPVQNKVITLALEDETARAKAAEARLERSISNYDDKLELIEDKLSLQGERMDNLSVKVDNVEEKIIKVEESIKNLDLEGIESTLTKVEEVTAEVEELVDAIDILNADAKTEGSVDNKIAKALDWEEINN